MNTATPLPDETIPTAEPGTSRRRLSWHTLRERRFWIRVVPVVVVLLAATWWYFAGLESTDDARIEGHVHPVAARISGTVIAVHVVENQEVTKDQLIFEIDPRDYEIALRRAEADLAEARAHMQAAETGVPITSASATSELVAAGANRDNARSGIDMAEQAANVSQSRLEVAQGQLREATARHVQAKQDLERLAELVERDEISRQQYDRAVAEEAGAAAAWQALEAAVAAARGEVAIARNRLAQARGDLARAEADLEAAGTAPQRIAVTEAEAASARARLEQAEAAVERARLDLEYTKVLAPATGVVSRKRVEIGQIVHPGQPLLAVVDLADVWVVANFKETQLAKMKPGQRATIEVDAYGGDFRARVESMSPATSSRFSLLPAENATGNFVKVVQRVPIKIVLEEEPGADRPLRPGMSVIATVTTRSTPEPVSP